MASVPAKFHQYPYKFKDLSLIRTQNFIGGKWISAPDASTFDVYDPSDDSYVGSVPEMNRQVAKDAIASASDAFKVFKKISHRERRFLLRRWSDLIKENKEDLAALVTIELGMPSGSTLGTVKYATDFLDWFEGEVERVYGETIPAFRQNNRIITMKQPQGVVTAITPFNSPVAMITRKVGAAIAAGNAVVCKPAPETPFTALALAALFERAGFPPGVFNVITTSKNTPAIGDEFCENETVKHLSFTGSTHMGKILNQKCAATIKHVSMELGGNAPFIVFDDANLDKAVEGCITSKYRYTGQTCVCANRIFVQAGVYDEFVKRLSAAINNSLKPGSVWDNSCNYGPLYSGKALEKIKRHIDDAVSKGGKLVCGGPGDQGPNTWNPTVISGANLNMQVSTEETFGPVAGIFKFDTEEEVLQKANTLQSGLASYFYTENIARLFRVAEELDTGMVGAGVGMVSACEQPFGGNKESGLGREGSKYGLDPYINIKSITIGW